MKRILAVMDSEEGYARRFMERINAMKQMPFAVHAFTMLSDLKQSLEADERMIVLISERDATEEVKRWKTLKLFYLTEEREDASHEGRIYKYQSAPEVIRAVLEGCAEGQIPVMRERGRRCGSTVVGIFSPVGRVGKTSLALTLGLLLASVKPVIYVTLEFCSGLSTLLHTTYTRSLADGIYFLRSGDVRRKEKLMAITERIGELEYLPPFSSPEELLSVTGEEWTQLLNGILESGQQEVMLLDLGQVPYCHPELLSFCDLVLEPVREDPISAAKCAEFRAFLEKRSLTDAAEAMHEIHLPEAEVHEEDRYPELLPYGAYGIAAKEVIQTYGL